MTKDMGAITTRIEASKKGNLLKILAPRLKSVLFKLSKVEKTKGLSRKALGAIKSFVNAIIVRYGEIDIGITIDAEPGIADSGNLTTDLPDLVQSIGNVAKAAGAVVLLPIDNLQYLSE